MASTDDISGPSLADLFADYRRAQGLEDRNAVAERIVATIFSPLSLFISLRRGIDPNKVPDVLMVTLTAIFGAIPVFRGTTHSEAWSYCYRIAFNKAMNAIRKDMANPVVTVPDEILWALVEASEKDRPMATGERVDLEAVMKLLRLVKPPCVDYLLMHYIVGLDYEQMADVLDMTTENVGATVRRCLKLARELGGNL
ncbi:MAG: sigma-70 family RNA polymerase sigma factor [Verrucomicrobia bacterium]|nr:sigma-70 family RNA polymerase sigma factor [Verrucomicrobiota bacterium]